MARFEEAITTVLCHEGGFCNDASDPGGATNFGVSLYWLKSVGDPNGDGFLDGDLNHDGRVNAADIRALTIETASEFYRRLWWDHYGFEKLIVQPVATKTFDTSVNMGGIPAIRILQQSANEHGCKLVVDGQMGAKTLAAVNALEPGALLADYRALQLARYKMLIDHNPKLAKFWNGWKRRAAE